MNGAITKVCDMDELQLRLRDARKVISDDGYNNDFAQVFNDAIDRIAELKKLCYWCSAFGAVPIEKNVLVFENPPYGDQSIEIGVFLDRGDGEVDCYIGNKTASVTHWMPLPAPPAGA